MLQVCPGSLTHTTSMSCGLYLANPGRVCMSAKQTNIQESLAVLATHDILCCPRCKGKLEPEQSRVKCLKCSYSYPITDNIPQMFCPTDWEKSKTDVTEEIKAF